MRHRCLICFAIFGSHPKTAVLTFMRVTLLEFHMENMYGHDMDRCRPMCVTILQFPTVADSCTRTAVNVREACCRHMKLP